MLKKGLQSKLYYILITLTGIITFTALYGWRILIPTYDGWLFNGPGDLMQHYLGWCFYRRGGWTFPIGLTDNLAYPDYSSVIYTDSIPVFAVFFKLLSPVLPRTFQYFGIWGMMCFILQGIFTVKILLELKVGRTQAYVASFIFMLSPIVIERMYRHTALGAHWLILACIYLFVRHKSDYDNIKKSSLCWGAAGVLIPSVHMYFLPMCGAFLGGYVLCSFIKARRIRVKYFMPAVSFAAGLFAAVFLLGGFSTWASVSGGDGLGEYSFNLNGFFNAKGYSRFFSSLPYYCDGQYEGFAYLGLGVFVLLFFAIAYAAVCFSKKTARSGRDFIMYAAMYVLMSAGLIVFAASPQVTLNERLLFKYPDSSTLEHYWGIFRSTGRIVWPVCYLIYIAAVMCNDRFWKSVNKSRAAFIVVVLCAVLQITDIYGKLAGARESYAGEKVYNSPLKSGIWDKIADIDSFEHIVWVSPHFENMEIMTIAKFAQDNELTMNNYYFARAIGVVDNVKREMGNLNDKCIYIFRTEEPEGIEDYDLYTVEADGYIIGVVPEIGRIID